MSMFANISIWGRLQLDVLTFLNLREAYLLVELVNLVTGETSFKLLHRLPHRFPGERIVNKNPINIVGASTSLVSALVLLNILVVDHISAILQIRFQLPGEGTAQGVVCRRHG